MEKNLQESQRHLSTLIIANAANFHGHHYSLDDLNQLSEAMLFFANITEKLTDRVTKEVGVPYIEQRLEYLRGEIEAERISTGEIAELQSLVKYIDPTDVTLLEWAGVEEQV